MNSFGAFAKQQRQAAGLTQAQLARACGFKHAASYAKLESRDLAHWKYPQLCVLADMLQTPLARLMDRYWDSQLAPCPTCHGSGRIQLPATDIAG